MKSNPLISVIIPVYNCADYIAETVNSVLLQSYQNFEIILINDGSTDSSEEVCISLGKDKDNIVYQYQTNAGVSAARNKGVSLAKGDYIAFLDGDDLWHPKKLETQLLFLSENPDYKIVCSDHLEVPPDFNNESVNNLNVVPTIELNHEFSGFVYHKQLQGHHFHIITMLIDSCYKEHLNFNPYFKVGEDYDVWLTLTAKYKVGFLKENLSYYRRHPASIMSRVQPKCFKAEVIEKNVSEFGLVCKSGYTMSLKEYRCRLHEAWFTYGYQIYHSAKNYKMALKAMCQAVKYKPLDFSTWKYLIVCPIQIFFSSNAK